MKFKNRMWFVLVIALIIMALILGAKMPTFFSVFKIDHDTTNSVHNLEQQISQISELATVKYIYKDVLEFNDSLNIKGINLPLTNKKYLLIYGGYIKAGVDLRDARIDIVDEDTVNLTLGKAKILDNVIDEDMISVYDERDGLFNRITLTDYTDIQKENKEKLENEIVEYGLLEEAEVNAEDLLRSLLAGFGFVNVSIVFE